MGISAKGGLTNKIRGHIATKAAYERYCNITTDQKVKIPRTLHGFSLFHLWSSEAATTFRPPVEAPLGTPPKTETLFQFYWAQRLLC